jgi:hypothetical protein
MHHNIDMGKFPVDTKVYFNFGSECSGTGIILGESAEFGITTFYIVLLDIPMFGQKAIIVPSVCLRNIN